VRRPVRPAACRPPARHPGAARGARPVLACGVALVQASAACAPSAPPSHGDAGPHREAIVPAGATTIAPYVPAVRTGGLVFFSGVIGTRPGTRELAAGGTGPETEQALANLEATMQAAGVGRGDVVKCTVFLANIGTFEAMNAVYGAFFGADPPARSTVGVGGLPLGAAVEIECIAAVPRATGRAP
jgi:2-iminobutanoate/2-iminopropanoate deaminase